MAETVWVKNPLRLCIFFERHESSNQISSKVVFRRKFSPTCIQCNQLLLTWGTEGHGNQEMFSASYMWTYRWVWWSTERSADTTKSEVKQNAAMQPVDQTHFSTNLNHRLENPLGLVENWGWILNYMASCLSLALQCSSFALRKRICLLKPYLLLDFNVLLPLVLVPLQFCL